MHVFPLFFHYPRILRLWPGRDEKLSSGERVLRLIRDPSEIKSWNLSKLVGKILALFLKCSSRLCLPLPRTYFRRVVADGARFPSLSDSTSADSLFFGSQTNLWCVFAVCLVVRRNWSTYQQELHWPLENTLACLAERTIDPSRASARLSYRFFKTTRCAELLTSNCALTFCRPASTLQFVLAGVQ